jgi:uncharacterized phage protein gp47/JayE
MTELTDFTYDYLKTSMLQRIDDTIDKREGSIIYDTTMPVSRELESYYSNLSEVQKQAYARTATGSFLDLIVAEAGISRQSATYSIKRADFLNVDGDPISISLGSRFSTITTDNPIYYYALSAYTDENDNVVAGAYLLKCESAGTDGNGYTGNILPITIITNLTTATMTTLITPAEDEEDDETLRARYFSKVSQDAFGGNRAQYKEYFEEIDGVGLAQIYPVWSGGGTVKCSIIDTSYNRCSTEFIATVQSLIDPLAIDNTITTGEGLGYAPIGHKVTVVTPSELTINISARIILYSNYSLTSVTNTINTALASYILDLRKSWATADSLGKYYTNIYYAKVLSTIINCAGVANVSTLSINGGTADITLTQTGITQQIPKLGTVSITI